jgi:hypothetical protein
MPLPRPPALSPKGRQRRGPALGGAFVALRVRRSEAAPKSAPTGRASCRAAMATAGERRGLERVVDAADAHLRRLAVEIHDEQVDGRGRVVAGLRWSIVVICGSESVRE